MVKVLENKKGGIFNMVVDENMPEKFHIEMNIEQNSYSPIQKQTIAKSCPIRAQLEIAMLLDYKPGNAMPGKIVTKETLIQPEDDPEAYLKWEDGKVCRNKQGLVIYSYSYYTEDFMEADEYI